MQKIERYLEQVEKQLYTEDVADEIIDELRDHIDCLKEDYIASGLSEERAITKALYQMGDPTEVGYSFTDYETMKRRNRLLLLFKVTGIVSIVMTFLVLIATNEVNWSDEGQSMLPLLLNVTNVWLALLGGSFYLGHRVKLLELDQTPYLILWPVPRRFKWEYWSIGFFFAPIVLLMIFIYFLESGISSQSFLSLWPLVTLTYALMAWFHAERFRMPKFMVVTDGMVIKGRLLSWTAMTRVDWSKDFMDKHQNHYKLIITSMNKMGAPMKKELMVHKRQYNLMRSLLKERV